jgi:hypothetical protein
VFRFRAIAFTALVGAALPVVVVHAESTAAPSASATAPRAAHGPSTASDIVGHRVVGANGAAVTTFVNVAAMRSHPVLKRLGAVFAKMPGIHDIVDAFPSATPDGGAPNTLDPFRAADWVVLFGPSTTKSAGLVAIARTGLPDATVDATFSALSHASTRGGSFDTSVPGVVAVRATPDRTERVMMRVQPGVVIVAPPDKAAELARTEQHATFPMRVRPKEALRVIIKEPSKQLSANFPAGVSELRVWIDAHDDGGADGFVEGECDSHEHAEEARAFFDNAISQNNTMFVRLATRGLLNTATTSVTGNTMKLHLPATRDQVDAIVALLEASYGVQQPPPQPAP